MDAVVFHERADTVHSHLVLNGVHYRPDLPTERDTSAKCAVLDLEMLSYNFLLSCYLFTVLNVHTFFSHGWFIQAIAELVFMNPAGIEALLLICDFFCLHF